MTTTAAHFASPERKFDPQPITHGRASAADSATMRTSATPPRPRPLTEREHQVLRGIARGLTNERIGRELYLTADTIKTHNRSLFRKLGARDRAHAVNNAWTLGILGGGA